VSSEATDDTYVSERVFSFAISLMYKHKISQARSEVYGLQIEVSVSMVAARQRK
jgi:hypothetical protein